MSYKLNDWSLSDVTNVTPKIGDDIGSSPYVIFDVPDLSVSPFTYISQVASSSDKGNSVEIVADLSDVDSGSYLTMYIDDGANRQGIKIYNGRVTLLDGSSTTTVDNPTESFHRYTITMKDGKFNFSFDKELLITTDEVQASQERGLLIGFPEEQSGSFVAKFQYIKYTPGVYKYVVLEDVDFELQLDSAPTFDTVNLHTYTKESFRQTPEQNSAEHPIYKAWDPVSYVCGSYTGDVEGVPIYDGHGIVTAVTVKMPQKPDMQMPTFYCRVRFTGKYESDFTSVYFNDRSDVIKYSEAELAHYTQDGYTVYPLPGYVFIYDASTGVHSDERGLVFTTDDAGFHQVVALTSIASIHLPDAETVSDGWKVTLYNSGKNTITVYDYVGAEVIKVEPQQIVSIQFDTDGDKWYPYIEQEKTQFVIRPDITSEVFKAVYQAHLPAEYDDVYTKSYDTGVAATLLRSESREIANVFTEFQNDSDRTGIYSAPNDYFTQKWGDVFQLDKSLFKNQAEMRDVLQELVQYSHSQTTYNGMFELLTAITGAKPLLTNYKDVVFNTVWSATDSKNVPAEDKFYLYDNDHPSFDIKPFVVYGGDAQAYTFQLDIYDPYDLKYDKDMVFEIIQLFKPGWTKAVTIFYDSEGYPYTKKYYYGIDNYNYAAYNK